ncbi:BgTH12-06142 [Blumeria graminis f. sp. triticale]|uniref:BgTH12-06142 n=1 Tax=Blumeria graminis f. sp. triticale TaxID=1689686 RepID=A0A9W4GGB2_BLUGR|nr:BgTH12-06142 [Blumeria graminis f. sp. triticale]
MSTFPNIYTHRKVADHGARPCDVCFKACTSVLVASGQKDFFFTCPAHLKDKAFCSPIIDNNAVAAQEKKIIDDEIVRLKTEYEDKKNKGKNAEAESDSKTEKATSDVSLEKSTPAKNAKVGSEPVVISKEEPSLFALHKIFFQQRLDKKKKNEMAKRSSERVLSPSLFPQVPKNLP